MVELVFDLASELTQKLGSLAYDEISSAWGVKSDLQKLEATMSTIKGVLLDAEEKQAHNQEVRSWLLQLKHLFRDTEDLLDEVECEALRRQVVENCHGTRRKVRRFFSSSNPIAFRLRISHEINNIRARIEELKANKAIFDLLTDHRAIHVNYVIKRENMTHSYVRASEVIGRDSDKQVIADLLMQDGDVQSGTLNDTLSVIPIVGIGGLGKTTLAKLVYNDERVVRHFHLRMWVYVSLEFDICRLTKEILSSALGTKINDKLSMDQMHRQLRDALENQKFLLVLDDVWNDDRIKWMDLREMLTEDAKLGSKILVTTRNASVASIMGTVPTYSLRGLSRRHCLSLFVKCAFKEGDEKQHPNLFEIGKDIVRKCGGAPLAVRTLGSQLYSKTDEREWKLIRDSEIWELEREGDGHIIPALRLSYTQLPSYLKQCLAYCSLLPKGGFSSSMELINCWKAHGFLQSRDKENLELDDGGELYFKELWIRCFFENVEPQEGAFNLCYTFSMHHLIHDLAQSVAQGECSIVNSGTKNLSENVRHLSFMKFDQQNVSTLVSQKSNKVRTMMYFGKSTRIGIHHESFLDTCFSRLQRIRVLRLAELSFKVLPDSIGTLKHLRYLDLSYNDGIHNLPNAICKLQSLQTLSFAGCQNLEKLARDICNLISLRSLELTTKEACFPEKGVDCLKSLRLLLIEKCWNLTSLPCNMSYLAALRTLIIVDCRQLTRLVLTDHRPNHVSYVIKRENMTRSYVRASEVIGRDSDKQVIADLLMQDGDDQSGTLNDTLSVIPIVGIGGLGKTTLAKYVYNDERVVRHFEMRMWAYVSAVDFDICRLTKEILSSALGTKISDELSMDQLQAKLREALKDKKFLLVLDDVWNEDRMKWSDLRDLLLEGAKLGSKILVTTRNLSVSSIMGTVDPYNLNGLSYEHCLSLFTKCAFKEGDEKQHSHLFDIGRDIVKKCGGAPLAVKTLGSQLYSKTDEREWKLVRDSKLWELEREKEGGGHILPALRLSYSQLPSYLKPCLAYCAYLEKGEYTFTSRDLIYCWMAHGIIQSRDNENLEMEDVGQQYFKELWVRSFFENVQLIDEDLFYLLGYAFSMHDLIYDLVQSIEQGEWCVVDSSTKDMAENVKHLSFFKFDNKLMVSTMLQKCKRVRSITAYGEDEVPLDESFLDTCFSKFKYLRVLRFVNVPLKELPSSIGTLKHLRYLNFGLNCKITKLSNAICKLQSLQILILPHQNLQESPRVMSNLINLRILVLMTKQACFQDNGVGCLKSLRVLSIGRCSNLISLPRETSYLAALRLLIIVDCKQLDLVNQHYQGIALRLEKLVIGGLPRITELPEWLQGAANTLQYLFIESCSNLGSLPAWLTNLTSLRKLVLVGCPKLLSLPEGMDCLTALRDLKIEDCTELERRCKRDTGEDWPKIAHIPNLSISDSEE